MSEILEVEKLKHPYVRENDKDDDEDNEEEEALSLCDLPVTNTANNEEAGKEEGYQTANDSDFDFDFGSLIGSVTAVESEMCAADEVFSGGQMLPFRHSVSSEVGLSGFRVPIHRSVSRTDSIDRGGLGSRSTSSRSSSTRSQHSATSSTSSGSSGSMVTIPKPKAWNHFHSCPSPNPQIRASGARLSNCAGSKSTTWQVLRLGLVRTPEIELQDLKLRNRTSPCNSDNNNNKGPKKRSDKIGNLLLGTQKGEDKISNEINKSGGGFFGNCKCSIGAIEPIIIPPRLIRPNYGAKTGHKHKLLDQFVLLSEDKELAQKKKEQHQDHQHPRQQERKQQQQQRNREKEIRQGKRFGSHHRTFEWLRDLSHTSFESDIDFVLWAPVSRAFVFITSYNN
ncbi:hypothetical protein Cgig2_010897 [Carnegiea gigantea]|uniref:Uncharacterized protein n=1 Tax=Carnegiea gigantea TaxID=171969 RepID=A0A9Q1GYZ5_9CARY|nr:hypothetical protein Cgig2_010897 [Carnegiea gigantea]